MADLPPNFDASVGVDEQSDRGSTRGYPGTPRWVKVFGIILIVLVMLVIVVMVTGSHGPGRHIPAGGDGGHMPPVAHLARWS